MASGKDAAEERRDGQPIAAPLLPGLDLAHDTLARKLVSGAQWRRDELRDVALGCDLMLDGALEVLNDASFEHYGAHFLDGDDPVCINLEVRERMEA